MSDFQNLYQVNEKVLAPAAFAARAQVPDYDATYADAMRDPTAYWDRVARGFTWFAPWQETLQWNYPNAKWFTGGKCNITVNCLDRHLQGPRRDKRALIWVGEDGSERIFTFAELYLQVCKLANALKGIGVGKGDRVCIYEPLTPEGIFTMLACARIGAVHSVVYAGLGAGALRQRIEDAGAGVVVCADVGYRRGKVVPLKPIVDEAVDRLVNPPQVVVHRRQTPAMALRPGEHDLEEIMTAAAPDCPAEVMDAEDWLFILYTSGSTGTPKGCAYVHGGYMVGVTEQWRLAFDAREDDIYWCMSDIGWIVGHSIMVYGPWCNGTTIVVREGAIDYPNPGIAWDLVDKYQISKIQTAPTAIRMWMRMGTQWTEPHDLTSLQLIVCAGEPLNPEAQLWANRQIMRGGNRVVDNWWQTETAAPTVGTFPAYPAKVGRAGKAFPGIRAEVLDRHGKPVAPHTGGFLCLRGPWPHMFRTIWGAHGRYEAYWNQIPGVYTAGDTATVDEDGYIMVLGRADDVLNVAGHRIGTADVESALVSHPAAGEAAVIGKPDPIKGEAIKAFVLLRAGHSPTDQLKAALIEHVRHVLGPIATPAEIDFVTKLPKTRSGKIMRRVLKAQELGIDPGDLTTIEE